MLLHIDSVADFLRFVEKNFIGEVYHTKPSWYNCLQVLIE